MFFRGQRQRRAAPRGPEKAQQKAFSLVLLKAAASAPRPASCREVRRVCQRTFTGSIGAGDHGRPQPACLCHTQADVASISSQRTRSTTQPSSQAHHQLQCCVRRCRSVCDQQSDAAGPVAVDSFKTAERKGMQSDCSVKQQIEQQEDVKQLKRLRELHVAGSRYAAQRIAARMP